MGLAWRRTPVLLRERSASWLHRGQRRWAATVAPLLVAGAVDTATSRWRTQGVAVTSTSTAVVTVASASGKRFVAKLACTGESADGLRRHVDALTRLRGDPRLRRLHQVMPHVVAHGEIGGRFYCVEEALPGMPASTVLVQRSHRARLLATAAGVIEDLHAGTVGRRPVGGADLDAWIRTPLRRLEVFAAARPGGERLLRSVQGVREELLGSLAGREVRTCWIHGDFWPGNVLATPAGTEVTGVVDWDRAEDRQLPLHDLLHLHVLSRRLARGDELGDVVVHALRGGIEEALGEPAGAVNTWLDGIPYRAAVLLYWLRHIVLFIDSEGHHDNRRWLRGNVEHVLANV